MDLRAMNAWKKFEQTGSIAAYMQYRQLLNNVDNGEETADFLGEGEETANADYDRWTGHQTKDQGYR